MESLINDYISREFVQDPALLPLANDTSLLETGILDSLSRSGWWPSWKSRSGSRWASGSAAAEFCQHEHHLRPPARPRAWKARGRAWVTTGRGGCCVP